MKLIFAFLIIGAFAILETAAVPLCICPRSPRQYVRQMYSLPRKYHSQQAVSGHDNVKAGSVAFVGRESDQITQEKAGEDNSGGGPRRRSSPSQPISESDNEEPSLLAFVSGDKRKEKPEKAGDSSSVPPRSLKSQSSRVFSGAESSQPEYVDLDDMRFLYGNYQR